MQICPLPPSSRELTLFWDDLLIQVKRLLITAVNIWKDIAQSEADMQQVLAILTHPSHEEE